MGLVMGKECKRHLYRVDVMAAGTTFAGMLLLANEEFMMGKKKLD